MEFRTHSVFRQKPLDGLKNKNKEIYKKKRKEKKNNLVSFPPCQEKQVNFTRTGDYKIEFIIIVIFDHSALRRTRS